MTDEATDIIQRLKKERDELGARVKKLEDENVEVHVLRALLGDLGFREREMVRNGEVEKAKAHYEAGETYCSRVHAERDALHKVVNAYFSLLCCSEMKKYEVPEAPDTETAP